MEIIWYDLLGKMQINFMFSVIMMTAKVPLNDVEAKRDMRRQERDEEEGYNPSHLVPVPPPAFLFLLGGQHLYLNPSTFGLNLYKKVL